VKRALRACLVGLVAVNLGFVHITEASRLVWLGPLVLLTLLSPLLLRLTRFWAYRLLWNLAVLGAFALLVHHVTYAGVAYLLEDGLLLAALCQVHLINNLSDSQKPDLIFFNSFLVAVVTSYLSVDVGYSVVFLLYAPLLILAMQLLVVARSGAPDEPGLVGRVVRSAMLRSAGVLAVTLAVFLFLPRDFGRRGLLGESLRLRPSGDITQVGFNEQVDLTNSRQAFVSDRVVMTVKPLEEDAAGTPAYWRGATLDKFDGRQWTSQTGIYEPKPWRWNGLGKWERGLPHAPRRFVVHLVDAEAPRAFTPLGAVRLVSATQHLTPLPDRNFRRMLGDRRPLDYVIDVDEAAPALDGRPWHPSSEIRTHILLQASSVPPAARELASRLRTELPDDVEQWRVVDHLSRYLTAHYRYLAPGTEGGAQNLSEFLAGQGGAHCEYFATALAIMLRTERIPCRVVTGYRSEEWNARTGILTVRARHAHAWVEVLDPQAGWYTVDPTPAVGVGAAARARGFFGRLHQTASRFWLALTGFNAEARDGAVAWLRGLPRRILDHALATGLCLGGLVLAFVALRLRRRRGGHPEVRAYRRTLRRLDLVLEPGETPRDLLARARRTAYPAEGLRRLELATAAHEAARYGV